MEVCAFTHVRTPTPKSRTLNHFVASVQVVIPGAFRPGDVLVEAFALDERPCDARADPTPQTLFQRPPYLPKPRT